MHEVQPYIRGRRQLGSLHLSLDNGKTCCKCNQAIRAPGHAPRTWTNVELQWKAASANCEHRPEKTTLPIGAPKPKPPYIKWSVAEDAIIKANPNLTGGQLRSYLPGRSRSSIIARAARMGLALKAGLSTNSSPSFDNQKSPRVETRTSEE